tara:strand:- start:495 stop:926 length:432 start_codon:yes stop_codon:yes gene_type:complete
MIKYKLDCSDCNKDFDSWFSNSKEYEKLKQRNLINCHFCGSKKINKSIMAPNVNNFINNNKNELLVLKRKRDIKRKIENFQNFIKNNFEYVGKNFAYEARSLHYNTKGNKKSIFGKASKNEIKELNDEGITTQIFPWIEKKDN